MAKKERKDKSYEDNLFYETQLWAKNFEFICGVDDVGRGCFAGPVVCAAAIMPKGFRIHRLTDSKLLAKDEHEHFSNLVKENALSWGVAEVDVDTIDEINIKQASRLAMKIAIESMEIKPEYILVDGLESVDLVIPQRPIIKGDFYSHSISSASIIAKMYRDELMKKLDEQYNNVYGWAKNAGYPTKDHIEATRKHGITPYHRKTWSTMEKITGEEKTGFDF